MSRFTRRVFTACMLLLVMLAGTAAADKIYRSVDAQGNVTFSSTPPADASAVDEVRVQPGPSEEEQREARERLRRQEATASEMGEARTDRVRQQTGAGPDATGETKREVTEDRYYGYPYPNTGQRDQVRDRLPARPVRPVQLPARPVPR